MSVATASTSADRFPSALCRQSDPELFFPDKGGSTLAAKKVCSRCVHFQGENECLEAALLEPLPWFGIRGGLSERERKRISVMRKRAVA